MNEIKADVFEFEKSISNIMNFMENAPKEMEELNKQLSSCDLEIADLEHYAEFVNFNASEGYLISKELKQVLKRRREVKRKLALLESTHTRFSCMVGGLKNVAKWKEGVEKSLTVNDNKLYTPRIRVELYDRINGIKREENIINNT